jgi:diaminopimelate epimerase
VSKAFWKYQSLGNDFIVFDFLDKKEQVDLSALFLQKLCDRHFGIGADGILFITNSEKQTPELHIYNADGSKAEVCFNGLRCVALHLHEKHDFGEQFDLLMGGRSISTSIKKENETILITNNVGRGRYIEEKRIEIAGRVFRGHVVQMSNPHFIIEEKISKEWLDQHGKEIETHTAFPNKTNVEFLWEQESSGGFHMLVHERGCGQTLACSSGVAAVATFLMHQKKISRDEAIIISMRGGDVIVSVYGEDDIVLSAGAKKVFEGEL